MTIMKINNCFIVLFVLCLFYACTPYGETIYNKDGIHGSEIAGEIQLTLSGENLSYDGCDIVTTSDVVKVQGDKFQTNVADNSVTQSVLLLDENDNVLLMSRFVDLKDGKLVLNEYSTALALATMHPLLAPLKGDDYRKIVGILTASDEFDGFVSEVAAAISARRNVFDSENESLLLAFNTLLESVAEKVNDEIDYSGSLDNLEGGDPLPETRALYESPKVYPLYADITGNVLTLRNVGLTPSYYGDVFQPDGSVSPFAVPSREDYGGMDLFKENLDEFMLGEPRTFTFSAEGDYNFALSRMDEAALADFWIRTANAVLSTLGLSFTESVKLELANVLSRIIINAGSGVNDDVIDPMAWVGIIYEGTLDWIVEGSGQQIVSQGTLRLAGVLLNSVNFYNKLKGVFNASLRISHMLSAPENIRFCLCYRRSVGVTPCSKSSLYIVDGDGQVGYKNQRLLLPLKVYVQNLDEDGNEVESDEYCRVRFEVVSGSGKVEDEIVSADHNNEAATYWTLGSGDEHSVKAVVVDLITGEEISEPVYFTATISQAQVTIRLDWSKHSCATDIDLHVIDPNGERICFYHMNSASGGYLDRDDVVGPGPEHIRWSDAPEGLYKIYVHYYPNGAEDRSITSYTVSVTTDEVTYQPKSGSIAYDQYVPVGQFRIGNETATRSIAVMDDTSADARPQIPMKK